MSEQAYTSIHYFTSQQTELGMGERFKGAFEQMKDDFTRAYQAMLDNSADLVIRKFDL